MGDLIEQWLTKELIKHPAVIFTALVIGSGATGFALNPFVLASDYEEFQRTTQQEMSSIKTKMSEIDRSLCQLDHTSRVNALEQKIVYTEQDIFSLERMESSGEAEPRDLKRLDAQRSRLRKLAGELEDIRRRGCAQ